MTSCGSDGKVSIRNAGDLSSIPGSGKSPGKGNGNPLQHSCLENQSPGQRSLAGYSPQGCKESDMMEQLSTAQHIWNSTPSVTESSTSFFPLRNLEKMYKLSGTLYILGHDQTIRNRLIMCWPKILFEFSYGMLRKNSNKLFRQTILGFSVWNIFLLVVCQCHCDSHIFCIWNFPITFNSVQSVVQLFLTFCNPMDCNTPGLPVHHRLPEFTQTPFHRVADAIQPSHPLSSPSPPAPNPSQHQSLFQWVNSSHEVAKVLEFQL